VRRRIALVHVNDHGKSHLSGGETHQSTYLAISVPKWDWAARGVIIKLERHPIYRKTAMIIPLAQELVMSTTSYCR
jgi:hypothetical protein